MSIITIENFEDQSGIRAENTLFSIDWFVKEFSGIPHVILIIYKKWINGAEEPIFQSTTPVSVLQGKMGTARLREGINISHAVQEITQRDLTQIQRDALLELSSQLLLSTIPPQFNLENITDKTNIS